MKQLIVLVATIILGISIGGTVVKMQDGVDGLAGAVKSTIETKLIKNNQLNLDGLKPSTTTS